MKDKKLLILGGTLASLDIIEIAKSIGVITYAVGTDVVDEIKSRCHYWEIISTTDYDTLLQYIKDNNIDGVFCGPSEFNLVNVMNLTKLAGLPFYASEEQWNICSDKASFKALCNKFNVPNVKEYKIEDSLEKFDTSKIEYPVIIKPSDGCSSKGISICNDESDLEDAYKLALEFSTNKKVIIEKFIQNQGVGFSARYIANDGDIYLSMLGDRYIVDESGNESLISATSEFPSKYTQHYLDTINDNVISMFKSIGIKNGSFFMQALPENGEIYFHEMGLRLSGGLTYKISEPLNGVNDVKMMIRYALGGKMVTDDEVEMISPDLNNKYAGSICIPLKAGVVGEIIGLEDVRKLDGVTDIVQYYKVGEEVKPHFVGTLMQHFCRVKFIRNSHKEILEIINTIQNTLTINDINNNDMVYKRFDIDRMK